MFLEQKGEKTPQITIINTAQFQSFPGYILLKVLLSFLRLLHVLREIKQVTMLDAEKGGWRWT